MELYEGVKFSVDIQGPSPLPDDLLTKLNYWAWVLSELGLSPRHPSGAYGNLSCRANENSFYITKSGMQPEPVLDNKNFCRIISYNPTTKSFIVEGDSPPSSETILHHLLYDEQPEIQAIFHGHSQLLIDNSVPLAIPVTEEFFPYGTLELALSAVEMIHRGHDFFLLKNHGFVSIGKDFQSTSNHCFKALSRLLDYLGTAHQNNR